MYSQDTAQQNEQRCSGATIRREDMMNYRSYTTLTCDMGGLLSSLKATLFYFTFNDVDTKRLWHDISCVWLWKRILHCQFHTTVCNFVDNIFAILQFSWKQDLTPYTWPWCIAASIGVNSQALYQIIQRTDNPLPPPHNFFNISKSYERKCAGAYKCPFCTRVSSNSFKMRYIIPSPPICKMLLCAWVHANRREWGLHFYVRVSVYLRTFCNILY